MRFSLAIALLAAATVAASAQTSSNGVGQTFNAMKPQDAARMNHAAQNDPKARAALDQAEKELKRGGHPAGTMLERTRP
jgi:type II secretory pathway component HofQ